MGRGEPEFNLREKADYGGKNIVHAGCWRTCPRKALRCGRGVLPFSHKIEGLTLSLRSRAHLRDYGSHEHRCYDTDLNDAAWAWIAPYQLAARSDGRPRTTDPRALLNAIFYLLRTGCQWRRYPASSRARAPFTITFVLGRMRASWPNCKGRFMSRRA